MPDVPDREWVEDSREPAECRACGQAIWIVYRGPKKNHLVEPRAVDQGTAEGKHVAFAPANATQPTGPPIGGLIPADEPPSGNLRVCAWIHRDGDVELAEPPAREKHEWREIILVPAAEPLEAFVRRCWIAEPGDENDAMKQTAIQGIERQAAELKRLREAGEGLATALDTMLRDSELAQWDAPDEHEALANWRALTKGEA